MDNCYVDDVLSGADSEDEALTLQDDLIEMFRAGGFNLRKWCSNNTKLLENVPTELRETQKVNFGEAEVKKSLGVHWVPFDDTIRFRVETTSTDKVTKRTILSNVAKLFDPLGLLSPIVVTAKLIIQELWRDELQWDDLVPNHIATRWNKFYNELHLVEEIVTPRWTQQIAGNEEPEIHGFCDASEKAIGAVIYIRTLDGNGKVKTTLLVAKSKVAPIKTKTTLPRLELCAAVLLAKLVHRVLVAFSNPVWRVHTWTDSMIVLAWITGDASRWKTFVANRVGEITTLIGKSQWHHVGTKDNPADVVSRGLYPSKMKEEALWWEGPHWLKDSEKEWPVQGKIQPTKIEERTTLRVNMAMKKEVCKIKFSSLRKTTRVTAYCLRFIFNCKNIQQKNTGPLSVKELQGAETILVKNDQKENWSEELRSLKHNKPVHKHSKISNLNPFLDQNGVIRVGGRLQYSLLEYAEKHPIIIASNSELAELLVRESHGQTLHGGNQQTLAYIRRKYWLINGKKIVKKVINKCPRCIRYRARTTTQLMGQLPASRVTPASAFVNTGVDYAGPIMLRTTKGRGHKAYKGYIAVFVCLTTKAVHLEVVSDMTSEMFMAALKRFTARRGTCANMYSDNGTTFVGASKLLEQEVVNVIEKSDIRDRLANKGTQWHFIPPSAPHFGGIWEAGVKSMKNHLKRVIGETTLTYEELTTLLHGIEACLNSRPLCPITDEINDVCTLTPGHFLIGRELVTPANPEDVIDNMKLTGRWKLLQKMKKDFWKVWSTEYLHGMQQMNKWKTKKENVKVGDIVLTKEDNISPSRWPLARVTKVHEDPEGLVRVVTIKRAEGAEVKRPVHKLIPLPRETETKEYTSTKKLHQKKTKGTTCRAVIMAIIFLLHLSRARAQMNYHIEKPSPGFYIEHLGKARVDQGLFRIQLKINGERFEEDMSSVNTTIQEILDLCGKMREISTDIECKSLVDRLEEEQKSIKWMQKGIETMVLRRRPKRGLWGNFLTSVFGVNDEVYRQIDELDTNQQKVIQASSHQTKVMLQTLAKFNDTEMRVTKKLNEFKDKLNKGLAAVQDMEQWYRYGGPDTTKLEIHLLSIFEVQKSYLDELMRYYKSVLNMATSKENLYELISPAKVEEIISDAMKKLPSNIEIMQHPIVKTEIVKDDNTTSVYCYFSIAEITEFNLIKANPIPLKVENGMYWMFDVSTEIVAINYNSQRYFELSDSDLRRSVIIEKQMYVCSPSIIRSIDNNPNCLIDELYNRIENSTCPIRQNKIHNMIWKKLYTRNTWIFIAERRTKIAIICNGEREETYVEQTGIIAISQNCIIATKMSILTPKRFDTVPVVAGYARPVAVNLTTSKTSVKRPAIEEENEIEPYDDWKDLVSAEENIQTELQDTHWKQITHHSALMSGITATVVIAVLIAIACGFKLLTKYCQKHRTQKRRERTGEEEDEGIEMNPLNRVDSTDPLRDFKIPSLINNESS